MPATVVTHRLLMGMLAGLAGACGATAGDAALTMALGVSRTEAVLTLRGLTYCRTAGPERDHEVYPACDRPGAADGDAWVVAEYRRDRLVRVQRFERFDDDARGVERWNQLVRDHGATDGDASAEARRQLQALRGLPDGTRSWLAFARDGGRTLVGVYLLTPLQDSDADVLEELVAADAPPVRAERR